RPIKFRPNPYDNAYSYYGSRQGGYGFFGYRLGVYGSTDRYATFSRRVPYGYSRFWTRGYGYSRMRRGPAFGYGRTIGENGDLFLFAPAILAPVGPLTGVF